MAEDVTLIPTKISRFSSVSRSFYYYTLLFNSLLYVCLFVWTLLLPFLSQKNCHFFTKIIYIYYTVRHIESYHIAYHRLEFPKNHDKDVAGIEFQKSM